MNVQFISSFSIITTDSAASSKLFPDTLGLPLEHPEGDEYCFSEKIEGCKHFGVWPLSQAAQACFGTSEWPADRPVPQLSLEFDLESEAAVRAGVQEMEAQGFTLVHSARTEPWGQTIARILTNEGAIVGLSYTPWMHPGGGA